MSEENNDIGKIANAKYQISLKLEYIKENQKQIDRLQQEIIRHQLQIAEYQEFLKKVDKNV